MFGEYKINICKLMSASGRASGHLSSVKSISYSCCCNGSVLPMGDWRELSSGKRDPMLPKVVLPSLP